MACVLIQHFDPNYPSQLPHILTSSTGLTVRNAEEGHAVEPNCVYVLPSNARLAVSEGRFQLTRRPQGHPFAIDHFLKSLAADRVRKVSECSYPGPVPTAPRGWRRSRPRAERRSPRIRLRPSTGTCRVTRSRAVQWTTCSPPRSPQLTGEADAMERIKELLRATTGVDFRHYKSSTLRRRMRKPFTVEEVAREIRTILDAAVGPGR